MLRFYRKKTEDLIIVIEQKLKIFIFLTMKKYSIYEYQKPHEQRSRSVQNEEYPYTGHRNYYS